MAEAGHDFPFSINGSKDTVGSGAGEVSPGLLWDEASNGGLSDPLAGAFDFSEEEKPKRGPKKTAEKPPAKTTRSTASERELAEIGESIEEKLDTIGALLSGIAPVTSVYVVEKSPRAIEALLSIAKRRPKVLAALRKTADGVDALELAQFLGGLVICMQVDAGRFQGDELPARIFGVTDILDEHFAVKDDQPQQNPAMTMQVPAFAGIQ